MASTLFIGLVTHPRSRFPEASGPNGLAARLTRSIEGEEWTVTTRVQADNLVDPKQIDLSPAAIRASIELELGTERAWWEFQHRKRLSVPAFFGLQGRKAMRRWKYTRASARTRGEAMLMRLANIEAAHLSLMEQAVEVGAQWILILEDDAQSQDTDEVGRDLVSNLARWETEVQPRYVNMSKSFALSELGLRQQLTEEMEWNRESQVLSAEIPFSNTVCAMLYRRDFLHQLLRELQSIPLEPVIPIDWKLNTALMALSQSRQIGPGDCYTISPAPIIQGSMHSDAPATTEG